MARIALVTGGTRGIGGAISRALREAGVKVAANYAGNDEAASDFRTETGIPTFKWDVGDFEACAEGVRQVEADLGPIDILVNNAGITRDGFFHKMTQQQWRAVLTTNLDSLFNMTRPVIDGMRARSWGRVIVISSINGQKGQMGQVNYSAAKAGVASRLTPSAPAISGPRWSRRSRRRCSKPRSCRRFRSAGSGFPRRSARPWPIWHRTMPPS